MCMLSFTVREAALLLWLEPPLVLAPPPAPRPKELLELDPRCEDVVAAAAFLKASMRLS